MTAKADSFYREEDVWARVTEFTTMFAAHVSSPLGDYWIVELSETPETENPGMFFLEASSENPNEDQNIAEFIREFKMAFYTAVFDLAPDEELSAPNNDPEEPL